MKEAGDEFGVRRVAFVAAKFLHAEGLDALGVDQIDAGRPHPMESLSDGIAVMTGLFQTSEKALGGGGLGQPADQGFDALGSVVETVRDHFIRTDEVTEEVGLADVDAQKEDWISGGLVCSFHRLVQSPKGRSKRLMAEESQSHQNRFG